jgi:cell division septation protein DedD
VQVQSDTPSFDQGLVGAPAWLELTADAPRFEHESRSPIAFEAPEPVKFDFYQDDDPVGRIQTVQSNPPAFSSIGSSVRREALHEGFEHSINTNGHEHAADVYGSHIVPQNGITESPVELDSDHRSNGVDDRSEAPAAVAEEAVADPEEAVTDPWEAPLAAWDYSRTEWPVLVGPTSQRSFRKLRWAIAAVVVLASAAGYYFLVYRPSTPQRGISTDTGTTAQVSDATGSADSRALVPSAPTQSDNAAAATSQPPGTATQQADATKNNGAEGEFSLQAAAFPTQGGADEFAERLKRAGVPSYVVPANVARRGRWFRVRVGRFNSAENAQKFAGEAQQRARAAGLAVQLIVCQFDQP